MKELALYVLSVLIGGSILICAVSYYTNSKSAQKIKNIETLYELKSSLENKKSSKEIDKMIEETERKIDSLNNEK